MSIPDDAMRELGALSGAVLSQTDFKSMLEEVCRAAAKAVPGTDGASITTLAYGRPSTVAMDDWSYQLDELQISEHEGPCLDAFRSGQEFRIRDIAAETRWQSYLPKASGAGVRSMMSVPMTAQGAVVGALNFYSKTADAFDVEGASIAEVVAAHAGLACQVGSAFYGHRDLAEQLAEAMQSRAVIEQAKGVLVAFCRRDPEDAWEDMVRLSQRTNRKLREIATEIVSRAAKGELDGDMLG